MNKKDEIKNKNEKDKEKEEEEEENRIPVLFFDEIGLAEISSNNPLTILYSYLEYDANQDLEKKIAFVGVSNWLLDASTQNRGIFISKPEPEIDDLIETTKVLLNTIKNSNISENLNISIAKSYHCYKSQYKELMKNYHINDNENKEDFHGIRDYYSFIKLISKQMKNENNANNIINIIEQAFYRNFSGLNVIQLKEEFPEYKTINDYFKEQYKMNLKELKYNIPKCIEDNLLDNESRYLLLSSNLGLGQFLLEDLIKKTNKSDKKVYLIGSKFKNDLNRNEYSYTMINQVMFHMEKGSLLILKNLDIIYHSLYDLFNQHYTQDKKKFSRISIGLINCPKTYINDDFKVVILLEERNIYNSDPPFLNRFEKHFISTDYLLNEQEQSIVENFNNLIEDIGKIRNNSKIDLSQQLINLDKHTIGKILYEKKINIEKDINKNIKFDDYYEELNKYLFKYISKLISQDAILFSNYFLKNRKEDVSKLINSYKNNHLINNLENVIKSIEINKCVIFTFTSISEKNNLKNLKFEEIFIFNYSSSEEIENTLENYIKNNNEYIFIHFTLEDANKHLEYIIYLINNLELIEDKIKKFYLIVHIKRKFNYSYSIEKNNNIPVDNFTQYFIDNLYKKCDFQNNNIINIFLTNENFFKFYNLNDKLYNLLIEVYMKFDINNIPSKNYKLEIIEKIKENIYTKENLINRIKNYYFEEQVFNDFFKQKNLFVENDVDLLNCIIRFIEQKIISFLVKLFFILESTNYIN